jgi:hypothetical protein
MRFQNIILIAISFTSWTSAAAQQFTNKKVNRIFSEILISSSGFEVNSNKFPYEQVLLKKSADTSVYKFSSDLVFWEETEMLTIDKKVFVNLKGMKTLSTDNQKYQKLLDFGLSPNDQWKTSWLFHYNTATIVFEQKSWESLVLDTLYRFRVNGKGLASHTVPTTRIYATKRLGIVRIDSKFQPESMHPNRFEKAIFVSKDYIKRSRLKDYFKKGLLKTVD